MGNVNAVTKQKVDSKVTINNDVVHTHGACLVDQHQNHRTTNACACAQHPIVSDDPGVHITLERANTGGGNNPLCHGKCKGHGHAQYASKSKLCAQCDVQAMVYHLGNNTVKDCGKIEEVAEAKCGNVTSKCVGYVNSMTAWLTGCQYPSATAKGMSGLMSSSASPMCDALVGINEGDGWVDSVLLQTSSDAKGMALRQVPREVWEAQQGGGVVKERPPGVVCFRHKGKYKCQGPRSVPVVPPAAANDGDESSAAARARWIAPRRADGKGTAKAFTPSLSGGFMQCAAQCTKDAVTGPADAMVVDPGVPGDADALDANTSRCIGFWYSLEADTGAVGTDPPTRCELYGSLGRPGFYDEGSLSNPRKPITEVEVNGSVVGQGISLTDNASGVEGGVPCSLGCSTSMELESQCVKESFKDSAPKHVSGQPCTVDSGDDDDDSKEQIFQQQFFRATAPTPTQHPHITTTPTTAVTADAYDWTTIGVACAVALVAMYIISRMR